MRITAGTLEEIARQVTELERCRLHVLEIYIHGHRVSLERSEHQLDGVAIFVTGIEPLGS